MRRVIKKIVTVVTTTTWKISWEPEASQSDQSADSSPTDLPIPAQITPDSPITYPDLTVTEELEQPHGDDEEIHSDILTSNLTDRHSENDDASSEQ